MLNGKDDLEINEKLIFDEVHASFIHSLVRLQGKCIFLHEAKMEALKVHCEILGNEHTFYSDMSDAISCMIVYLINEEISNMSERPYFAEILINATNENYFNSVDDDEKCFIIIAHENIKKIFVGGVNEITRSYFVDFTVGTFSVFEKWMCKIYPTARSNTPSKGAKKKNLVRLIQKFQNSKDGAEREGILHKIMNDCGSHVSSAEMIEFVVTAAKENYQRNANDDKETIRFYGARRNTIHNLGIHEKESFKPMTIKGRELSLEKGRGASGEDLRAIVDHCEELVDIYTATVESLRISNWNLYFQSRNSL